MQSTVQRVVKNPLVSRFDADPGPWRPMYYPVEIDVPLTAGQSELGSVTINNQPYIWMFLGHQIIGNTADPETSGLYQDGQYDIEMKDDLSNYQLAPICASASFGGGTFGYMIEFPIPICYPGAKTITFRVINRVTRVLTPEPADDVFTVKLVLGGVQDWGSLE